MPFATGNRRTRIMVASVACLLLLGWTDYATGYEFGFFIFYFIPVSIAAYPQQDPPNRSRRAAHQEGTVPGSGGESGIEAADAGGRRSPVKRFSILRGGGGSAYSLGSSNGREAKIRFLPSSFAR
jgi:hypothetical protein